MLITACDGASKQASANNKTARLSTDDEQAGRATWEHKMSQDKGDCCCWPLSSSRVAPPARAGGLSWRVLTPPPLARSCSPAIVCPSLYHLLSNLGVSVFVCVAEAAAAATRLALVECHRFCSHCFNQVMPGRTLSFSLTCGTQAIPNRAEPNNCSELDSSQAEANCTVQIHGILKNAPFLPFLSPLLSSVQMMLLVMF